MASGVPRSWLGALVASGHLRRPLRGVYVAATVPDSVALRVASLRLVVPADAVVCDRHAGWLHGAEMVLAPNEHLAPRPIAIFRYPGADRLHRGEVASGQRALLASDVVELDGLLVTTPLRTALDLGRRRSRVEAISGLDAMMRVGVSRDELIEESERFAGERWVRTLRELAPLADARSASPGESACKLAWWNATGSMPELQLPVRGADGASAYLDLGHRELRFAVEYDGAEWHDSPEQQEHDAARRAAVTANEGYDIRAVRAPEVFGPERRIETIIRAGLRQARLRASEAA